jgi:MFS transporter, DHA2 family, multidrug resistance protein
VMPPATELVMSVVPRDRGGAGSAITNISRQVAVALGVAVLGSVLAQAYRAQLTPHLGALPPAARNSAFASIAATQAAAQHLGPAGSGLLAAANQSFVHAMHLTTVISFFIAVLGAVVLAIWMPGRSPAMPPALPADAAGTSPAIAEAAGAER